MSCKNNWMIGMACHTHFDEALMEEYAKAGFDCLEFYSTKYDDNYEAVRQWSKNTGVRAWSRHLNYTAELGVCRIHKEDVKESLVTYKRMIDEAAMAGCSAVVVHPSNEVVKDERREELFLQAAESFCVLVDHAKQYDITVCCENLPRSCLCRESSEMLRMISLVPGLKICLDTNHVYSEDMCDFISKVSGHIYTTHVSDCGDVADCHWLPGKGSLNWKGIIEALENGGYEGPFLYEVTMPEGVTSRDVKKDQLELWKL